jgi:hypothetical protein
MEKNQIWDGKNLDPGWKNFWIRNTYTLILRYHSDLSKLRNILLM